MSQARTGAWWRQAHNDLALADLARSNGFHAQACFFAAQAAEKALKGALLELGREPPHTHVLGQLVQILAAEGLDATALASLPLPALTRMTVTSRYPLDDTPPQRAVRCPRFRSGPHYGPGRSGLGGVAGSACSLSWPQPTAAARGRRRLPGMPSPGALLGMPRSPTIDSVLVVPFCSSRPGIEMDLIKGVSGNSFNQ